MNKEQKEKSKHAGNIRLPLLLGTDSVTSLDTPVTGGDYTAFVTNVKALALFLSGLCTILVLIFLIRAVLTYDLSGESEGRRKEGAWGILAAGGALALLGGIGVPVGIFWNLFHL